MMDTTQQGTATPKKVTGKRGRPSTKQKLVVSTGAQQVDIASLIGTLGKEPKKFREELGDIATALNNQPLLKAGEARLNDRRALLRACKIEIGDILIDMYSKKQISEEIALKVIERFKLCQLNRHQTPKAVGMVWLKQVVCSWKKDKEAQAGSFPQI